MKSLFIAQAVLMTASSMTLWFKTGFETASELHLIDAVSSAAQMDSLHCMISNDTSFMGDFSLKVSGEDLTIEGPSYVQFQIRDVNIPVNAGTNLIYFFFRANSLGRYATVDLIMTDGTTLGNTEVIDQNGISMGPSTAEVL